MVNEEFSGAILDFAGKVKKYFSNHQQPLPDDLSKKFIDRLVEQSPVKTDSNQSTWAGQTASVTALVRDPLTISDGRSDLDDCVLQSILKKRGSDIATSNGIFNFFVVSLAHPDAPIFERRLNIVLNFLDQDQPGRDRLRYNFVIKFLGSSGTEIEISDSVELHRRFFSVPELAQELFQEELLQLRRSIRVGPKAVKLRERGFHCPRLPGLPHTRSFHKMNSAPFFQADFSFLDLDLSTWVQDSVLYLETPLYWNSGVKISPAIIEKMGKLDEKQLLEFAKNELGLKVIVVDHLAAGKAINPALKDVQLSDDAEAIKFYSEDAEGRTAFTDPKWEKVVIGQFLLLTPKCFQEMAENIRIDL